MVSTDKSDKISGEFSLFANLNMLLIQLETFHLVRKRKLPKTVLLIMNKFRVSQIKLKQF